MLSGEDTQVPSRLLAEHPELEPILAKYPQLKPIAEALDAYDKGLEITTRCPKCGSLLQVDDLRALGSLWVRCENGHALYHEQYEIKPESAP